MPTTLRPSSTGSPEILCCRVNASTSCTDMVGGTVIGSLTTPLSNRLTLATSAAWAFGGMFLCTIPIPPSWAIAIARRASVTVSIAAERSGMFREMLEVRRVWRLTSRGTTVEWAGSSRTSSKVRAFWTTRIVHFSYAQKSIIRGWRAPVNDSKRTAWRQRVDEGLGLALPCHNSCSTGPPNEAAHRVYLCRRIWRFPRLGVDRLPRNSVKGDRGEGAGGLRGPAAAGRKTGKAQCQHGPRRSQRSARHGGQGCGNQEAPAATHGRGSQDGEGRVGRQEKTRSVCASARQ